MLLEVNGEGLLVAADVLVREQIIHCVRPRKRDRLMNGISYETPRMGRLVCFLALLLAACQASDPEAGVSRERVSLTGEERRPTNTPKQPPEWFEEQIALVDQDWKAGRIREALVSNRYLKDEGHGVKVTASFGIAHYPSDASDLKELLRNADLSLYRSKDRGKDTITV